MEPGGVEPGPSTGSGRTGEEAGALSLCLTRFVVPDRSAIDAIRHAIADAPRCIVVVRDAFMARSPRTPFRWEERAAMVRDELTAAELARTSFVPLRELYDEERTARQLEEIAGPASPVIVHWAGEQDPVLQDTLANLTAWTLRSRAGGDDGSALQRALFEADSPEAAVQAASPMLPDRLQHTLGDQLRQADFDRLRAEHAQYAREKQQWSVAPYPVTLVTVDALVRAADHVLLIRRGRLPGRGLRALPGGFLEREDTVYHSAVRELQEETQIALTAQAARALLRGVHVFDHPRRSQRGRVVTHAHYFDLGDVRLPAVRGGDDAAAAEWVHVSQLAAMEEEFHDDHFHILDHFLGLSP